MTKRLIRTNNVYSNVVINTLIIHIVMFIITAKLAIVVNVFRQFA